ncbi:MAG: molybdopterin oxidoreductase family protein, partial [Pseudomonadota bacterium]
LPAFTNPDGTQKYADYADYIVNHERKPGIGPLAGWRMGENGLTSGRGDVNKGQLDSYIKNGGFFVEHIPDGANYYKPWNAAYQDWAVGMGLFDTPQPYLFSLYVEPMRRFQLAAEGHGDRQPPDHLRDRIKHAMDPLPMWYDPAPDNKGEDYPITALTQRPMAMYHSWGSQNAWLRQLHGHNPLYLPTRLMRENDLKDGDWAKVTSPHGDITVPVLEMAALNENTVWTWNAIGKRKGAWALDEQAPEATKGFLLNHLIHELLPPKGDGLRWANSDPITGQAAWFDLKVRIEKAEAPAESQPSLPPINSPVGTDPGDLAWKIGK